MNENVKTKKIAMVNAKSLSKSVDENQQTKNWKNPIKKRLKRTKEMRNVFF